MLHNLISCCVFCVSCRPPSTPLQDVPGAVLKESRYTEPGQDVVVCKNTPGFNLGLSTCYDVRFPEMYMCLAARGAQVCRLADSR